MREALIIRNFGPIKEVELNDIKPFTVFIGESGSGKSTIMKALILFRWIYKMVNIRSYLRHSNISKSPFRFRFDSYLKATGLNDFLKSDTEIEYRRGNYKITYAKGAKFDVNNILIAKDELSLEKLSFIADKRNVIPDLLAKKKVENMGFYLEETFSDFNIADDHISELPIPYLGIRYFSKKSNFGKKYFIEGVDDKFKHIPIKLENASSGMQTVTPLSVIIEYFAKHYDFKERFNGIVLNYLSKTDSLKEFKSDLNIGEIRNKNIHIHIEEPELSLYPESQRNLINFIVNRCFIERHNDYKMTVMLATHSPYIINHLNLLIKASDKNFLIEEAKLAYEDIAVYQIEEGKINDLKIQNERLINTNPLSDTIDNIYDEYEQL